MKKPQNKKQRSPVSGPTNRPQDSSDLRVNDSNTPSQEPKQGSRDQGALQKAGGSRDPRAEGFRDRRSGYRELEAHVIHEPKAFVTEKTVSEARNAGQSKTHVN